MAPKIKNKISGWINLNKPEGVTSNDAVMIVKRALGFPKIGHAGTLDPLASGILPIALGEATKLVQYMMEDDKVYLFTVTWGEQRSTDDEDGNDETIEPSQVSSLRHQGWGVACEMGTACSVESTTSASARHSSLKPWKSS